MEPSHRFKRWSLSSRSGIKPFGAAGTFFMPYIRSRARCRQRVASSACSFWQKQAFPELRCATPNSRSQCQGIARKFKARAYSAIENDPKQGSFSMAERARFELAVSCPTLVFKTSNINHSVTSPGEQNLSYQR